MKYETKLSIVISLIVVLVVTFSLSLILNPKGKKIKGVDEQILKLKEDEVHYFTIENVANNNITKITQVENRKYQLELNGKTYFGDLSKISNLTNYLYDLKSLRTITDKSDKLKEYNLDKGEYNVKLYSKDDKLIKELIFGSKNGDYNEVFFREANSNSSKLVSDSVSYYIQQDPVYYVSKELYSSIGSNNIEKITLIYEGKTQEFHYKSEKGDDSKYWFSKNGDTEVQLIGADNGKLLSTASALSYTIGDEVYDGDEVYKKEDAKYIAKIEEHIGNTGRKYELYFFPIKKDTEIKYLVFADSSNNSEFLKYPDGKSLPVIISQYKFNQTFSYFQK